MAGVVPGNINVGMGVISSRTAASGSGGTVLYSGFVSWMFGARGEAVFSNTKPKRPFEDSDNARVFQAAAPNDYCLLTMAQDGTVALFTPTEMYGTTGCE